MRNRLPRKSNKPDEGRADHNDPFAPVGKTRRLVGAWMSTTVMVE
jgi:hypothetical protein